MYTEYELCQSLKAKDIKAFRFLYLKYSPALLGILKLEIANSKLSEATLQAVFVKIWQNFHQYDPAKGRLFSWMYQLLQKEIRHLQPDISTKPHHTENLFQFILIDKFNSSFLNDQLSARF
jgi:hypothetical protein